MPPKNATKKLAPKAKAGPRGMAKPIPAGLVMTDLSKKQWKLGPVIGQGGFGYIYLGAIAGGDDVTSTNADHVIKVEPHDNGPLFVELAFYVRVAKAELVNAWMKNKNISQLGIPLYIGSGSFDHENNKYRFMVISRFGTDVEKIYTQNDSIFPEKTVYSLGLRIVDVLEYLHDNDYVHADIKSSNLMMGYKKGDMSKVYLLDYGLAYKYKPGGTHVAYKEDPKRKHDGTIEYTSRDAHKGVAPTRRGDMEILGYCMIQWLCGKLPWEDKLKDKEYVFKQKEKYMGNLKEFMSKCFTEENRPDTLQEYMELVNKMGYSEKPDYEKIRKLFKAGLKQCGAADDGKTVCLPTAKPPRKLQGNAAPSPRKPRPALKDLPPKNSPRKTPASKPSDAASVNSNTKKRGKSPIKKQPTPVKRIKGGTAKNSPRKVPSTMMVSEGSPVKKVQAAVAVRRSPRNTVITSDESSDEDNEPSGVKKAKKNIPVVVEQDSKEVVNGCSDGANGSCGDRVVVVDGVKRTVHRRVRKRNVSTRDFAQSP